MFTGSSSTALGCPHSPHGPVWFRWPRAVAERGGLKLWSGVPSLGGFHRTLCPRHVCRVRGSNSARSADPGMPVLAVFYIIHLPAGNFF